MFEGDDNRPTTLFDEHVATAKMLLKELLASEQIAFRVSIEDKAKAGIYVLFEGSRAVYVGRTRNLQGRFRAHVLNSHNSASFALKRTRARHPEIKQATYKAAGSRAWIVAHPVYGHTFREEIAAIKTMKFKFLEVPDKIDQYLLELLATMTLGLELDGFDSY